MLFFSGAVHLQHTDHFLTNIRQKILTVNFFASIPPSIDELDLRNQRISTRLFILLFICSVTILVGYISLVTITKMNVVNTPTLEQYASLYSIYPESLICPCSRISINYDQFLDVNYTMHQVCQSLFITKEWVDILFSSSRNDATSVQDFRSLGVYTFQALSAFCEISQKKISSDLTVFNVNQYITASVTAREIFKSQTEALFEAFKSSASADLSSSFLVVRDINQANGIMSITGTQYMFEKLPGQSHVVSSSIVYSDCICSFSPTCVKAAYVANFTSQETIISIVPGMYVGCLITEALLQSSLQCFFNQTCVEFVSSYLSFNSHLNVTALDPSLLHRYSIYSTIKELVDRLMVEDWTFSNDYSRYYNACQPSQCSYTYRTRNDAIYIISTLFGLIGGLVTVLKLFVSYTVKYIAQAIIFFRRSDRTRRSAQGKLNHV